MNGVRANAMPLFDVYLSMYEYIYRIHIKHTRYPSRPPPHRRHIAGSNTHKTRHPRPYFTSKNASKDPRHPRPTTTRVCVGDISRAPPVLARLDTRRRARRRRRSIDRARVFLYARKIVVRVSSRRRARSPFERFIHSFIHSSVKHHLGVERIEQSNEVFSRRARNRARREGDIRKTTDCSVSSSS